MSKENILSLNGQWQIKQLNGKIRLTGRIPGLVHHDLIDKKIVHDPFYRMNEKDQQWVGDSTWEYTRDFQLTGEQAAKKSIVLNCEGIDTLADVYVNGKKVGSSDNMFVRYRWNIKSCVNAGKNSIRFIFYPARKEMERRAKKYPHQLSRRPFVPWEPSTRCFVRKSQCHSGWDWGPCFLTQGIYRDICIECRNGAKILYLTQKQSHGKGFVDVALRLIVDAAQAGKAAVIFDLGGRKIKKRVQLRAGEQSVYETIRINHPRLWWPNGYGKQELYTLHADVQMGNEADEIEQQIGLRNMELVTKPDEAGTSFYFRVNGVPIFAKGNNWIPSDSFDSRLTDDQVRWELESAAKAHNNMIRVWGGGLYERDSFYELCDKLGLMVWQDFMFACSPYPTTCITHLITVTHCKQIG